MREWENQQQNKTKGKRNRSNMESDLFFPIPFSESDTTERLIWSDLIWFRSVQFTRSVVSYSLQPHRLQHARAPCPSPTPRVYSNSCPLSQWCHPTILYSLVLFSSCLQSFPASGSFQISQFFTSGGQSIGVSALASVLPMNTQDWSPLGWTGLISLQSILMPTSYELLNINKHQLKQ